LKSRKRSLRKPSPSAKIPPQTQRLITRLAVRVINDIRQMNHIEQLQPQQQPSPTPVPVLNRVMHTTYQRPLELKQIKALVVSLQENDAMWRTEQQLLENLRLLTREANLMRPSQLLSASIELFEPDIILVLPGELPCSAQCLERLGSLPAAKPAVKAVWLSDAFSQAEWIHPYVSLFQHVMTQSLAHVPLYQKQGFAKVHYLPFAADRARYFPKTVADAYRSDYLLIGNVPEAFLDALLNLLHSRKDCRIRATDYKGTDERIEPIRDLDAMDNYYNGARFVLNFSPVQQRVFEIAACGVFQLAPDHPGLHAYMQPNQHIVTFSTPAELIERIHGYEDRIEQMRMVSSKALWGSHYDFSYLQIALKLLHVVLQR